MFKRILTTCAVASACTLLADVTPFYVTLTFDDALRDHIEVVKPLLAQHGWKGAFNVPVVNVGKDNNHMTWTEIKTLLEAGHEICSHGENHVNIGNLMYDKKYDTVHAEFADSWLHIRDGIGTAPRFFCYPFGAASDDSNTICMDEGYDPMPTDRVGFGLDSGSPSFHSKLVTYRAQKKTYMDVCFHAACGTWGGYDPFSRGDSTKEFEAFLNDIANECATNGVQVVPYSTYYKLARGIITKAEQDGAGERWVSPTGDDVTGDGSQTKPWKTPQKAVDSFGSSLGTVHLSAGTYRGPQPILNLTNGVSVVGAGMFKTMLQPDNTATAATVLLGVGSTVSDLRIMSNTTAIAVQPTAKNGSTTRYNASKLDRVQIDCNMKGGTYISGAAYLKITNARLLNNHGGGAVSGGTGGTWGGCDLSNCLVAWNTSKTYGGGLTLVYNHRVHSCTVVSNSAPDSAGVYIHKNNRGVLLRNTIVRDNFRTKIDGLADIGPRANAGVKAAATLANCWLSEDARTVWGDCCTNCISGDPVFAGKSFGNFALATGSVCIDKGDASVLLDSERVDLVGNDRVFGEKPDVGCYEFQGSEAEPEPGPDFKPEPVPAYDFKPRWVSPTGDDSAGGTQESPWRTPQKAIDFCGGYNGTVYLSEGTYTGSNPILNITNAVTIVGAGRGATILRPDNTVAAPAVQIHAKNSVISNLTVTGCSGAFAVQLKNGGSLAHCDIVTNTAGGVWICSGSGVSECINCNFMHNSNASGPAALWENTSGAPTIRGCLFARNTTTVASHGAVTSDNGTDTAFSYCTFADNVGKTTGAIYLGDNYTKTFRNCIFSGNSCDAGRGTPDFVQSYATATVTFDHCRCDQKAGENPVVGNPSFKNPSTGDYHLTGGSCCVDSGMDITGSDATLLDLDAHARVYNDVPDLGCYEWMPSDTVECSIQGMPSGVIATGTKLTLSAVVTPRPGAAVADYGYAWTLINETSGSTVATGTAATFTPMVNDIASYSVTLTVTHKTDSSDTATQTFPSAFSTAPGVVYVVPAKTGEMGGEWPYDSWEKATTNIELAVAAVALGGKVMLGAGVHELYYGSAPSDNASIVITRDVILEGAGENYSTYLTNTKTWHRPIALSSSGAVLRKVSFTGLTANGMPGRAVIVNQGTLEDCHFVGNTMHQLENSSVVYLAKAQARATRCLFAGNGDKGANVACPLVHLDDGLLDNCLFVGNTNYSGFVLFRYGLGRMLDCTLADNTVRSGGGNVRFTAKPTTDKMINCVLGTAKNGSGGTCANTWCTTLTGGNLTALEAAVSNCCYEVGTTLGANALAGDPKFVNAAQGDYRLESDSPCVNTGLGLPELDAMTDFDGRKRVKRLTARGVRKTDRGCYESMWQRGVLIRIH